MGRFLTMDTWNGDETQPMSYNMWLYGFANPIRYTDPSGYVSCDSFATFSNETEIGKDGKVKTLKEWRDIEKSLVCQRMDDIAQAYAKIMNLYKRILDDNVGHHYPSFLPSDAFSLVHGGAIEVRRMRKPVGDKDYGPGGQWMGTHIEIYDVAGLTGGSYFERHSRLIVHEMGHAFLSAIKADSATSLNLDGKLVRPWKDELICHHDKDPNNPHCTCPTNTTNNISYYGYFGDFEDWQFGFTVANGAQWKEEIADMYVGWVYGQWENSQLGRDKSSYMAVMMFGQIVKKMPEFRQ
jgi:hypothetical protein